MSARARLRLLPNGAPGQLLRYLPNGCTIWGHRSRPRWQKMRQWLVGALLRASIIGRPPHRFRPAATRGWPSREFHNWPAAPTIGELSAPSALAICGRCRRSGSVADPAHRMHRVSDCLKRGALFEQLRADRAIAKEVPRCRRSD